MKQLIEQANWVDIFVVILILSMSYSGIRAGLIVEIFRLIGVIFAMLFTFHVYTVISDFLSGTFSLPLELTDTITYVVLLVLVMLSVKLLRDFILKLIKVETIDSLNKWGGAILGNLRGFLFTSIILAGFVISGIGFLENSTTESVSGTFILRLAPGFYRISVEKVISKLLPSVKLNKDALELLEKE